MEAMPPGLEIDSESPVASYPSALELQLSVMLAVRRTPCKDQRNSKMSMFTFMIPPSFPFHLTVSQL